MVNVKNYFSAVIISFLSLTWNFSMAQIQLNNNLIFSDSASSRNIKQVGTGYSEDNLVSAKTLMENKSIYFSSGIYQNDTLALSHPFEMTPVNGTLLIVKTNFNLTGDTLNLSVNNIYNYPVKVNGGVPLSKSHIKTGQICVFQLNSDTLYLLNPAARTCPSGFAEVNDKFCIEKNERSGIFFTAIANCVDSGYRLCTWAEWYYACQKNIPGVNTMINNWEWVNSFQNEPDMGKVVGSTKCDNSNGVLISGVRGYRCCFSK